MQATTMAYYLLFVTLFTTCYFVDAGYIGNFPCSVRNTAYYEGEELVVSKEETKCVDITNISPEKIRGLNVPFKSADTLYADGMMLKRIPKSILHSMPNLEEVDLSKNKLRRIMVNVFTNCPNLKRVLLQKNHISFKAETPFLKSNTITDLVLSDNRIERITEKTFSELPNLKRVFLDRNKIGFVDSNAFSSTQHLRFLNLEENCIEHFPPEDKMPTSLVKYVKGSQCSDIDIEYDY